MPRHTSGRLYTAVRPALHRLQRRRDGRPQNVDHAEVVDLEGLAPVLAQAVREAEVPFGLGFTLLVVGLDAAQPADRMLAQVADRFRRVARSRDVLARLAEDEFAVVVPGADTTAAARIVARRVRDALTEPDLAADRPAWSRLGVGAAVYGEHATRPPALLRAAQVAMRRALDGATDVAVFEDGDDPESREVLATELSFSIDPEQIVLVFQPEFSLSTGEIAAVEALARWHRGDHQLIPPDRVTALARHADVIHEVGLLVLRMAVAEVARWRIEGGRVPVAVSVPAELVCDRSFPHRVTQLLRQWDLEPSALVLQVSTTPSPADLLAAVEVLGELRSAGVRVELDDFGRDGGSFGLLRTLPLDGVKLHRTEAFDARGEPEVLLTLVVEAAHERGLSVAVEGVEDAQALQRVRDLGIDVVEGYLLGRPMSAEAVAPLVRRRVSRLPAVSRPPESET